MNILITGGCGFIGINLISYLHRHTSHKLSVLDDLSLGNKQALDEFNVQFFKGDIRNSELVTSILEQQEIEGIIHLAADTRVLDSIENPGFNYDVNCTGTFRLLEAARNLNVARFVLASTGGAIIGDAIPPVHEEMVPRPISPYGASKLVGEAYCSAFAGAYGLKTVSLRFSNVYGPRSFHKGSVVAHFLKQIVQNKPLVIYGDGSQTRDFVFVDDLCAAIENALSVDEGGLVCQLGSGIETSVNLLVELIQDVVGNDYHVAVEFENARTGEVLRNYGNISYARKTLGYDPKINLDEGLVSTWDWFKSNQSLFVD